jgi:hypothetical protein
LLVNFAHLGKDNESKQAIAIFKTGQRVGNRPVPPGASGQIGNSRTFPELGRSVGQSQKEHLSSGLSLEAVTARFSWRVGKVPTTEVADSFDYLVGLSERRRRAGKQFYVSLASPIA